MRASVVRSLGGVEPSGPSAEAGMIVGKPVGKPRTPPAPVRAPVKKSRLPRRRGTLPVEMQLGIKPPESRIAFQTLRPKTAILLYPLRLEVKAGQGFCFLLKLR